jgi:murein DD-endopeptidase MepM/ murein hydrolase activator NlpD
LPPHSADREVHAKPSGTVPSPAWWPRCFCFFNRIILTLAALLFAGCFSPGLNNRAAAPQSGDPDPAAATELAGVKVFARREGDRTRFIVKNFERTEVTMTFAFSIENLRGDVTFPHTATFGPGETDAFVLTPADPDEPWSYAYTNYFKLGSAVAVPDDYVYSLPYAPGAAYPVSQGYNGGFSHQGANQYAIDWRMPEGTVVLAARGGLVVKVKDNSARGGDDKRYDRFNNYVLVRHADGTLGHYCHLKMGSARVVPGQTVEAGDPLALSGNTGFSSGPHLHFCVFKTRDGRERASIPVKFRNAAGAGVTLIQGRKYKAAPLRAVATAPERTPVTVVR